MNYVCGQITDAIMVEIQRKHTHIFHLCMQVEPEGTVVSHQRASGTLDYCFYCWPGAAGGHVGSSACRPHGPSSQPIIRRASALDVAVHT